MEPISISTALTSINLIRQGLAAAIAVRDFNQAATEIAKLNEALLDAQNAQLAQIATLFSLQSEKFEAAEELRKLREALAEKGRYSLFALSDGNFVYRVNRAPQESGASEPVGAEPDHYVCQGCFDKGVKVVLRRISSAPRAIWQCHACRAQAFEGRRPRGPNTFAESD